MIQVERSVPLVRFRCSLTTEDIVAVAEAHAVSPSVVARVQRFWLLLHASDVPERGREAALMPLVFAGLGRRSPRWLLPLKPLDLVLQENYTALKRYSPHKPPNDLSEQLRKFVAIRFDMERVRPACTSFSYAPDQ